MPSSSKKEPRERILESLSLSKCDFSHPSAHWKDGANVKLFPFILQLPVTEHRKISPAQHNAHLAFYALLERSRTRLTAILRRTQEKHRHCLFSSLYVATRLVPGHRNKWWEPLLLSTEKMLKCQAASAVIFWIWDKRDDFTGWKYSRSECAGNWE